MEVLHVQGACPPSNPTALRGSRPACSLTRPCRRMSLRRKHEGRVVQARLLVVAPSVRPLQRLSHALAQARLRLGAVRMLWLERTRRAAAEVPQFGVTRQR